MKPDDILFETIRLEIKLSVTQEGKLHVDAPKGRLTPALQSSLSKNRDDIIELYGIVAACSALYEYLKYVLRGQFVVSMPTAPRDFMERPERPIAWAAWWYAKSRRQKRKTMENKKASKDIDDGTRNVLDEAITRVEGSHNRRDPRRGQAGTGVEHIGNVIPRVLEQLEVSCRERASECIDKK